MPQVDRAGTVETRSGEDAAERAPRERWLHTTEERDAARLLLLQEITAALSEARDTASVVDVICGTAREWLEADSAVVSWLDRSAGVFRMLGLEYRFNSHFCGFPLGK